MDLKINIFNQELIALINKNASDLPVGIIYFILLNAIKEVENLYKQSVEQEISSTEEEVVEDETGEFEDSVNFSVPIDEIPYSEELEEV